MLQLILWKYFQIIKNSLKSPHPRHIRKTSAFLHPITFPLKSVQYSRKYIFKIIRTKD